MGLATVLIAVARKSFLFHQIGVALDHGYRVVLTADRTLMSNYGGGVFYGFLTTGPIRGFIPPSLLMTFVARPVKRDRRGGALLAPHGLRRIEAALIESGVVGEEELIVARPEDLRSVIGTETRVIGISAIDPLGKGPASTTFSGEYGVVHAPSITTHFFRKLVTSDEVQQARRRGAFVVVGGPGAWQITENDMRKLGIDIIVDGEGELLVPELFRQILEGNPPPTPTILRTRYDQVPSPEQIPRLRGGTVGGIVEVSRGCGRGCRFCSPTLRRLRHRPIEDILYDVKVNVHAGQTSIVLHAEDVLRYGVTSGYHVEHDKVVELVRRVAGTPGVEAVCFSHAALAPIAASPRTVEEISEILNLGEDRFLGFQTGIETGSPRLIAKFMNKKPAPFKAEEWPDVVEQAFGVCVDNYWVPCGTLIINLPGETAEDIIATIELLDRLKPYPGFIVPLLFVPYVNIPGYKAMRIREDAAWYHWELFRKVFEYDFRWMSRIARMYTKKHNFLAKIFIRGLIWFLLHIAKPLVYRHIDQRIAELKPQEVPTQITSETAAVAGA